MGKSYEGRDIWVMTLTNFETGPDNEKPAYWVDGNIHATEVSSSAAVLYLINRLLAQYGADHRITYALDSRVFYVVPRLNPDGAEWALADKPKYVRSSTRPYPRSMGYTRKTLMATAVSCRCGSRIRMEPGKSTRMNHA
jgi:murein tripeptide amidase MpaA